MPSTTAQATTQATLTSEHFAYDGPLPIAAVVVLGCLLLGLFAWSLRRERHVMGVRNAVLFWTLRAAAVGVALWMLMAPSNVRVEQSTTRKSVALVVDISPSMQTVDPPATTDEYRWAMAANPSTPQNALAIADRASAAAALAAERLQAATVAVRDQRPERTALKSAVAAHEAIERVRIHLLRLATHLQKSSPQLAASSATGSPGPPVPAILETLEGSEFQSLAEIAGAVQKGQDAFQPGWRESLVDLDHQMSGVRQRLAELAQTLAENAAQSSPQSLSLSEDATGDEADRAALLQTRQSSRLQRVARFIEAVEGPLLKPLSESVDFRHVVFHAKATPLPDQELLDSQLGRLLANSTAAGSGEPQPPTAEDAFTDIAGVLEKLRQMQREQPLAAVFLLTDVAHNRPDGRDPGAAAAELSGTPVYIIPIGNTQRLRDVELKSISAPSVVMKDDEMVIEAKLEAYGCEGEQLRVELLREGAVIQHRDLQVDSPTALLRARFNTKLADVGLQRCQIRIVPVEAELSEVNNFDQFQVNVTRNHIRVLLADSLPRWEYRYLSQLFRRDTKVECDELLFHPRKIATGKRAETQGFPTTVDEWADYDVILLGDVSVEQLPVPSQESLAEFVRHRGGTLVIIAGQESMPHRFENQPLEAILPVTQDRDADEHQPSEGYTLQVTEAGWRHHALMITDSESSTRTAWDFINRNAPFYWLSPYHHARPTAQTLITAAVRAPGDAALAPAHHALLCWQPMGRGRAVFLASPETFRLRFLRGDRLHYRFWGQLLRWAIASELATGSEHVRIRTDRPDYRSGDSVQVVVRLNDEAGAPLERAAVEAVAVAAGETSVAIPLAADEADPGRYLGTFEQLPAGIYQVEPKGTAVEGLLQSSAVDEEFLPSAHFAIRAPLNREILDTRSDLALAHRITEATGGQVLPPTAMDEVLALTDLAPIITETTERLPLWAQWKYLWIVFCCLCSEWIVRKRLGLS